MEAQRQFQKRRSQDQAQKSNESEKTELIQEILKLKEHLQKLDSKLEEQKHRNSKVVESNGRNQKRLLRYRARIEEMTKYRDSPEHFLAVTGHMNESIQEYILAHNYAMNINPQQTQELDPDRMTYEQLIELGDRIGKVSKGLSKEEIQKLNHRHHKKLKGVEEKCPICQNQLEHGQIIIELRCKHTYHEECIIFWLKDENTCPLCKEYLAESKEHLAESKEHLAESKEHLEESKRHLVGRRKEEGIDKVNLL